ncbi:MAG: hypothetical protein PHR77_16500 [Kiritimatiellae bacterium]|nr:hypothetical protein [Kiritimatiellia bacterium]
MSVKVISSRMFEAPPGHNCKVCDDPTHAAFSWQYAQEDRGHELHALRDQLKQVKSLKFGHLYACQLCGLNWILDETRSTMTRVPNDRRDILNEWNENQLSIEQEQLRVLDAIGGIATTYCMGHYRLIVVPCAISMRSGERIDPAVVWITDRPPIDDFVSRIKLYQNISIVEPSLFALPMDVRRATVLAGEVSMGFAPTRVVATNGTPFVLHWGTSLFNQDGITGSEIRLSAKRFRMDESIIIAEADFTHATYFFADWFEGAENLNKAQSGNQLYSKLRAFWKRLF